MERLLLVTVCEYASIHPDGAFTVVRGGLATWSVPEFPTTLSFHIFMETVGFRLESGEHSIKIVISPPGQPEPQVLEGKLINEGVTSRVTIQATALLLEPGELKIDVQLDDCGASTILKILRFKRGAAQ